MRRETFLLRSIKSKNNTPAVITIFKKILIWDLNFEGSKFSKFIKVLLFEMKIKL